MDKHDGYTITIPNEQTVTFGLPELPISAEYPAGYGASNHTVDLLYRNLREAFRRIDELQREVAALKRTAASPDNEVRNGE